ncbi:hypothetical protein CI592_18785, partial [Fischerella thermalis CCMEE 5328]
ETTLVTKNLWLNQKHIRNFCLDDFHKNSLINCKIFGSIGLANIVTSGYILYHKNNCYTDLDIV